MNDVPTRTAGQHFATLIGAFVVGPLLGLGLGEWLAPDTTLAQLVSIWIFPLIFFAGHLWWLGSGVASVIVGAVVGLIRGRRRPGPPPAGTTPVPSGYGAFRILGALLGATAGALVSVSSDVGLGLAVLLHGAFGLAYGIVLSRLASLGFLPFPEPA